jgi:hypothetical protein
MLLVAELVLLVAAGLSKGVALLIPAQCSINTIQSVSEHSSKQIPTTRKTE